MTVDYILASLPSLSFDAPPPMSTERFREIAGSAAEPGPEWTDFETELKNAVASARNGEKWLRPVRGCRLFWRNRVFECFRETDVAKRQDALDKVWWDAAGELADSASPLGRGALAAYGIRLAVCERRASASKDAGMAVFSSFKSTYGTGNPK